MKTVIERLEVSRAPEAVAPETEFDVTPPLHDGFKRTNDYMKTILSTIITSFFPTVAAACAVYFRSVPGRYYGVQNATDLSEAWTLQAVRVASTSQTRFVLPASRSQDFYRVLALP